MTDTRRPLLIVSGVVATFILVTLIATVLRPVEQVDSSTPEGVVQLFIQAMLDDNDVGAEAFVTSDFLDDCDLRHGLDSDRYSIDKSREIHDGYLIEVTSSSSDYFSGDNNTEEFMLVEVDNKWLIDWISWPFDCGEFGQGVR